MVSIKRDIEYAPGLKCDVQRPDTPGSYPLVLGFHGGGWDGGDKGELWGMGRAVTSLGCVFCSVNYHLGYPASAWPNQLADINAALAFARDHAASWWVDPSRVAVMGTSAGGHLAQMLASDEAAGITCALSFSGPTDFPLLVSDQANPYYVKFALGMDALFGAGSWTADDSRLRDASSVAAATSSNPPAFIAHSVSEYVPVSQAEGYAAVLGELEVPNELHLYEGDLHGVHLWPAAQVEAMAFLEANL